MVLCIVCGAKNPDYANFCQKCGKQIHSKIIKEEPKHQKIYHLHQYLKPDRD